MRLPVRITVLAAPLVIALGLSASAGAATVKIDLGCYVNRDIGYLSRTAAAPPPLPATLFARNVPMVLAGTGFPARSAVAVSARVNSASAPAEFAQTETDGQGDLQLALPNPDGGFDDPAVPVTFTVVATAGSTTAMATGQAVQAGVFSSEVRDHGQLATRLQFAGFPPARGIYGHFLEAGTLAGSRRLGTTHGACGLLNMTLAQPWPFAAIAPATYTVQYDDSPTYTPHAAGSRTVTYTTP